MTNQQFFDERDHLLKAWQKATKKQRDKWCPALMARLGFIPSEAFIKKFYDRMPSDEKCEKNDFFGDHADYVRWGFALWNDWEEDEESEMQLCLFDWGTYYGLQN